MLSAPLNGWKRFPAAQEWLDEHANGAMTETRREFNRFLATRTPAAAAMAKATPDQNAALFQQFLEWQKESAERPPPRRLHKHKAYRAKVEKRTKPETGRGRRQGRRRKEIGGGPAPR